MLASPYSRIYLYVRFLEFPKPRRSDRETDRIQSRDPDRQTRCYPINSSIPYSNWSEFLVDRRDRIAVCHQCNINYPPAVSRSLSLLQLIMFKYRSSIGSSRRSLSFHLDNGKLQLLLPTNYTWRNDCF